MAQWGKNGLLSDKEEIFYPEKNASTVNTKNLPLLYGPTGQVKTVVEQYSAMEKMLASKKMTIKMLMMSQSGAWFVRLTTGTVLLLGREHPLERLTRFLRAYEAVFMGNESAEDGLVHFARRVDLRYPHGMAISWATEPVEEKKQIEDK
jgi:cell division protein FtsQ